MKHAIFRGFASIGAALSLAVASSPRLEATPQSSARAATVAANQTASPVADARQTGQGLGSMIACAGCVVAAGFTIAGGPAAILVAVNAPGSAIALLACVAACEEALK